MAFQASRDAAIQMRSREYYGFTRSLPKTNHAPISYKYQYTTYSFLSEVKIFFIILYITFIIIPQQVIANTPFSPSLTCPVVDTFFDSTSLSCNNCPVNMSPSSNMSTISDGSHVCQCSKGFATQNSFPLSCTSCLTANQPAWSDGSSCTTCDTATGATFSLPDEDCICADATHILVETDSLGSKLSTGKQCSPCPLNSFKASPYHCESCPDPSMSYSGTPAICTCPTGTSLVHSTCFPTTAITAFHALYSPSAYGKVLLRDVASSDAGKSSPENVEVTSHLFSTRFLYHALRCQEQEGRSPSSCHAIANMCAAAYYSKAHPACKFFSNLAGSISATSNGFTDWASGLPWLFYSDASTLVSDVLQSKMRLAGSGDNLGNGGNSGGEKTRMQYVLAKYDYEGAFLGFEILSSQLQQCDVLAGQSADTTMKHSSYDPDVEHSPSQAVLSTAFTRHFDFGTDALSECKLDLTAALQSQNRDIFYELYYVDDVDKWYPVPVKSLSFLSDQNGKPNVNSKREEVLDRADIKLVRRFFINEALSSIPLSSSALSPNTPVKDAGAPVVLRYASSITIRVTIRDGSQQHIYPPVLIIDHSARRVSDLEFSSSPLPYSALTTNQKNRLFSHFQFQQEYRNSLRSGEIAAKVFFGITIVACALVWIIKVVAWQRREKTGITDFSSIVRVLIQAGGTFGEGFFWLMFGCSAYVFIFFKGQDEAHVLLPTSSSIFSIALTPLLIFCFIGLFLAIIHRILYQISLDVMLIDWEAKDVAQRVTFFGSNPIQDTNINSVTANGFDIDIERSTLLGIASASSNLGNAQPGSVSAWRRVLITNKWIELQNARRLHIPCTILLLLLLLHAIGLQNLATAQPIANDLDPNSAPISPVLRFFVTSLLWLCVGGVQIIFQFVVLDLLQPPPTTRMIDLLTSTNISLCVFDHRFHMFYLHGKSVHEKADVDFAEMSLQTARERRNLVRPRGLYRHSNTGDPTIDGLNTDHGYQHDELPEEGESSFSVFLSPDLRAHYENEYSALLYKHVAESHNTARRAENDVASYRSQVRRTEHRQAQTSKFGPSTSLDKSNYDISEILDAELASAQLRMNRFLCEFIDRSLPMHRYEIVPRGYFATWLDLPPTLQRSTPGMSIFAPDPSHTVKK